jgi:hypothetical protein
MNTYLSGHPHLTDLLKNHLIGGIFINDQAIVQQSNDYINIQYRNQWIHNQTLIDEIKNISEHLQIHNISGTLLKGFELIHSTYQDIGRRFMSDIDILIEKKDLDEWKSLLTSNGYQQTKHITFYANNFKSEWTKKIGLVEVNIELHTKIYFHIDSYDPKKMDSPYPGFSFLTKEEQLLHLCYHLAFQHNFSKLYWLYDIYFFLSSHRVDWNLVNQKKRTLKITKSVDLIIHCIRSFMGNIQAPPSVRKYPILTKLITANFLLEPEQKRFKYLMIKLLIKDDLKDSLKYFFFWAIHKKVECYKEKFLKTI